MLEEDKSHPSEEGKSLEDFGIPGKRNVLGQDKNSFESSFSISELFLGSLSSILN